MGCVVSSWMSVCVVSQSAGWCSLWAALLLCHCECLYVCPSVCPQSWRPADYVVRDRRLLEQLLDLEFDQPLDNQGIFYRGLTTCHVLFCSLWLTRRRRMPILFSDNWHIDIFVHSHRLPGLNCRRRRHFRPRRRRFWHAPLRLRSAIRRHHPPQRAVLSQICCFGERKVVLFQILLDGAEPRDAGTTWLSSPVRRYFSLYQLFCRMHIDFLIKFSQRNFRSFRR